MAFVVKRSASADGAFASRGRAWSHEHMSGPNGFDYRTRTNGEVHIFLRGTLAKMLKDEDAQKFLAAIKEADDDQQVMEDAVGAQNSSGRVSGGPSGPGSHLHGNGLGHAPTQFRRKTG